MSYIEDFYDFDLEEEAFKEGLEPAPFCNHLRVVGRKKEVPKSITFQSYYTENLEPFVRSHLYVMAQNGDMAKCLKVHSVQNNPQFCLQGMTLWRVNRNEFIVDLKYKMNGKGRRKGPDSYREVDLHIAFYVTAHLMVDDWEKETEEDDFPYFDPEENEYTDKNGCRIELEEGLHLKAPKREEYQLDRWLIPYFGARDISKIADDMWANIFGGILPLDFHAYDFDLLRKAQQLRVERLRLLEEQSAKSILYWTDTNVITEDGERTVTASTVVINDVYKWNEDERVRLCHEIWHDEFHYVNT